MASEIKALSDLKGKRVAVMHGSSQLERVQALDLDLKLQITDFALQNYVAVTEGKADFTVLDSYAPVGASVSAVYPDLKVALRLNEFSYGAAARKGSDLLAPFNAYLAQIKKLGEMARIVGRHLPEASAAQAAPDKP
jgi:ABC-type amino acid transport substrate-binding protein